MELTSKSDCKIVVNKVAELKSLIHGTSTLKDVIEVLNILIQDYKDRYE